MSHPPRPNDDTLRAVLPPTRSWPVLDAAGSRAHEQQTLTTSAPHALMARAGLAVARLVLATQPLARSVLALAGPGNNGGDAVVAATLLHQRGWQARVCLLGDPARLPSDARWAINEAQAAGLAVASSLPARIDDDVALDGLLGLGTRRAPAGLLAEAIQALNAADRPVVSIDLPSGLDPDRGVGLGPHTVRAQHTLALLTLKPGLFTADGRDHAGRVWLDTLGVELPASAIRLAGPPAGSLGLRPAPHAAHKGRFGDVSVIGGAQGMVGAAWLAARAALSAGAGRVYIGLLVPDQAPMSDLWPELMQRDIAGLLEPAWLARQTVACGCGGAHAVAATLPAVIMHAARLVLDADALNAIAGESGLQRALVTRGRRGRPTVLTPHPLEAARLLATGAAEVQSDRLAAARELAMRFGCVALLKGSGTLVASPQGELQINPTGNALLSTAGTGDVLAGWMAGLWARAGNTAGAAEVAAAAAFRHGLAADDVAADAARPSALRASDLIERMRTARS